MRRGQAVDFWAELYAPRIPAIDRKAPFISRDIDFCGDVRAARICTERLGGTAEVAIRRARILSGGRVARKIPTRTSSRSHPSWRALTCTPVHCRALDWWAIPA
jgi:hypothetical protein